MNIRDSKGKYGLVEHQIYTTLTKTYKYNTAIACGILANIQRESSFNPNALNKYSNAYGLLQWLGSRKTNLISYCKSNTSDSYTTVAGQLAFMLHELSTTEKKTWNSISNISNTATGAETAGYIFSRDFERHGNSVEDRNRGDLARNTFWGFYSKYSPEESGEIEIAVSNIGSKIVEYARSKKGSKYSPGGKGPTLYDEVGLVYDSYNYVGKPLSYMSAKALYNILSKSAKKKVTSKEASAGDLIFYDTGDYYTISIANGSGGEIVASNIEREVVENETIRNPYAILRILSSSETGVTSGESLVERVSIPIVDNSEQIRKNLSKVKAAGYDYGYLIDITNGEEFKFYIPEFTEQAGANWSSISIVGRSVDVKAYDNTSSRNITISLDLYAGEGLYADKNSTDIVGKLHSDLNFVKSLEYPDYSDAIIQPPPTVHLILGSAVNLEGVVSGVSVEHLKPFDEQNRAMYAKLSFTVTQTAANPPDFSDIRKGRYNLASTSDISSLSIDDASDNILDNNTLG